MPQTALFFWKKPSLLEKLFHLKERGTTARTELAAGLTTFMTMAYIIFVNPSILSSIKGLQHSSAEIAAATCLAAAVPTLLMGLFTNTPYSLAPGMGLNGVLTYTVCLQNHVPWQTAMGVVVVEGCVICILVLTRTREAIMKAIPMPLKRAISVGIGLFITLLGFMNAGLAKVDAGAGTLAAGGMHDKAALLAVLGLVLTLSLFALGIRAALLLGIAGTTLIGLALGICSLPHQSLLQPPHFTTLFHANIAAALKPALWGTVLAFVMSDFFDAMGTIIGLGQQAELIDEQGNLPRLREILLIDGFAALWGGLCGASSATTYIESASGIAAGGRTGLTSVVCGLLFLVSLFFAPLIGIAPAQATAPVLILVGFFMLSTVQHIQWNKIEEALPAFLIIVTIPYTYSISRGIGFGFIAYLLIMLVQKRFRDIHPVLVVVSLLFALSFVLS